MGIEENDDERNYEHDRKKIRSFKLSEGEDYIENIMIKTEEQNTFDSLTSLDLKATRKDEAESKFDEEDIQKNEPEKSDSEHEEE